MSIIFGIYIETPSSKLLLHLAFRPTPFTFNCMDHSFVIYRSLCYRFQVDTEPVKHRRYEL